MCYFIILPLAAVSAFGADCPIPTPLLVSFLVFSTLPLVAYLLVLQRIFPPTLNRQSPEWIHGGYVSRSNRWKVKLSPAEKFLRLTRFWQQIHILFPWNVVDTDEITCQTCFLYHALCGKNHYCTGQVTNDHGHHASCFLSLLLHDYHDADQMYENCLWNHAKIYHCHIWWPHDSIPLETCCDSPTLEVYKNMATINARAEVRIVRWYPCSLILLSGTTEVKLQHCEEISVKR